MKSTRIAIVTVVLLAAATVVARAPVRSPSKSNTGAASRPAVQVFVPGNASGYFGRDVNVLVPLVPAIAVSGPGTITVTYVSGTVDYGTGVEVGPNGGPYHFDRGAGQYPLQERHGVCFLHGGSINNMAALFGVFVPQARAARKGFTAVDGTKNVTRVGIMPGGIFFIGEGKNFAVEEAGTLFLGINDNGVVDNSGGFNVEVSAQ